MIAVVEDSTAGSAICYDKYDNDTSHSLFCYAVEYACRDYDLEWLLKEKYTVKPVFPVYRNYYQSPLIASVKYHHKRMISKSGFLARKGKLRKRGKA